MQISLPPVTACYPVIPYQPGITRIQRWDLSENYTALTSEIFTNLSAFTDFIEQKLQNEEADFGIGGYNELRGIYARSGVFGTSDSPEEPRRLHLGVDIWGPALTPVYAVYDGVVHSQAFHPELGNYGGVVILQHSYQGNHFYTLYGHLTEQSVHQFQPGENMQGGRVVGAFGNPTENGGWPPHLHFQCMLSMENWVGDYPGVCKWSERDKYLQNCPDPALMLRLFNG